MTERMCGIGSEMSATSYALRRMLEETSDIGVALAIVEMARVFKECANITAREENEFKGIVKFHRNNEKWVIENEKMNSVSRSIHMSALSAYVECLKIFEMDFSKNADTLTQEREVNRANRLLGKDGK